MSTSGGNASARFVALLGLFAILDMLGKKVSVKDVDWNANTTGRGVSARFVALSSLPMILRILGSKVSVKNAERSASTSREQVAGARSVALLRGMVGTMGAFCRMREKTAMQKV